MAQSDVFDILLNLDLSKDGAEKQAKAAVKELSSIFEKVTEIKPNLSTDGVKLNLKELQTLFRNFGATVDGVFDFSGATKQLEQLIVNLKTAQGEMSKTTISFGGADKEGNIQTSISSTRVTSLKEQEKDIQNIVNLVLKEDEAWQKVQESQKTGNAIIQDYYNSVLNATTREREFAETNFEKKYGDLNQVPALWQEIEDRINRVNNLEQENKKIAATEEYKKRANEVKEFKEALDALVQSQKKMGSLLGSGKGDTEEFSVALAQWTAAKNVLEGFGATVTDTGVKITKNSEIVKQNQTAFEGLDEATKEASVDMIAAYAKLGDTANLEVQKRAVNDFEKALNKLVSTRQKMYQLEGQGKTDTNEYKVLAQQYDEAKQKLEGYGATVTDTSVKIEKDSLIVNNNADTYDKLSNKLDDVNDKLPLYKAKAEDAGEASKGAEEKQNSFSQSIQSSVENFIKYRVAMEAINKITSEFTSAIYDMNEAMTQVRMVTMGSYEDTVALADSYTKLAKQLGTTTTTVAEGADSWLRQGYNAQEAMEMLKQSTTLAVVGQLDAASSTDQLTAITKSYNVAVEDTSQIVDKLVAADLNYAASTGEISTALQKVASSAGQAGLGLDKLIGLITISEEKTRQAPEVIGSAWQSIIARIGKITSKVSLDDLVDENGKVVATINDADKVLSKYGINLVDTSGKMRDMGTIMDEIGAKWGQMSTLEQNQLAYVVLISYNMK